MASTEDPGRQTYHGYAVIYSIILFAQQMHVTMLNWHSSYAPLQLT